MNKKYRIFINIPTYGRHSYEIENFYIKIKAICREIYKGIENIDFVLPYKSYEQIKDSYKNYSIDHISKNIAKLEKCDAVINISPNLKEKDVAYDIYDLVCKNFSTKIKGVEGHLTYIDLTDLHDVLLYNLA